jgi:hypothetical protein
MNEAVDVSAVSPQCTFLESHPKPPTADSTLYLSRSVTSDASGGQHHTIVGVRVVLADGNPNGLWAMLHVDRKAQTLNAETQRKDPKKCLMATRSLTICCDRLEVHGALCVPEADVTIYARELAWATDDASIDTSPLSWDVATARDAAGKVAGQKGVDGRNAGAIKVFVSAVEPAGDTRVRLLAQGGAGQSAGHGLNGTTGTSLPSWRRAEFAATIAPTSITNRATVDFSPPAVYIEAQWYFGPIPEPSSDTRGVASFPTNGTDAVAPGTPGEGGDGGGLLTNSRTVMACLKNDGGPSGARAMNRVGGAAGTPSPSARYRIELSEYVGNTEKASFTRKMIAGPNTTRRGKDAPAPPAATARGATPAAAGIDSRNAWLHPLSLQTVLEYGRDLFLAGAYSDLQAFLTDYGAGLALPMPARTTAWDDCPWGDTSLAQWTAAQTEVASMQNRLHGHLDYFGNPAGYTPLLSLQGSIKLYEGETKRALRTILLVNWVAAETSKAQEASDMLGDLVDGMNEDSARAAEQVAAAQKTLQTLTSQLDGLQQQLSAKGIDLEEKRTELLAQAETTEHQKALIKGSIKMAGAICQVIPVGQPVLGAVGSLAGVSADLIGADPEGMPDTVSKMGDVISKAQEAARKADEASKKAADAKKPEAAPSAMGTALAGVGPALSQASQAISALQVPQSAVDAELLRLESECPELQQILDDIRGLNERKTGLFGDLTDAFQSLSDGYSRLSSNAAAIVSMQQQKGKQIARIDHEASLFVRQIGQRSRLTLLKYLYFMVKSYETTVLQPLDDVDWELSRVTGAISGLLAGTKFDRGSLQSQAQDLDSLFQDNINVVRQKLLEDASALSEITMPRPLVLSQAQSPADLSALNTIGRVEIEPFACGLIDPKTQLARLSDVDLVALEFDPAGPALPDGCQVAIDLIPAQVGTLRRAESLCAIYSEAPVSWTWTSSGGQPEKSPPSKGAEDLIEFVLGDGSDKIRQKIARPPFWSRLVIRARYLPALPADKKPRITRLQFRLSSDVVSAPDRQSVLMVHPAGPSAGGVIDCTPKDLGGRGTGLGHFMRIYNTGAGVQLSVPADSMPSFDHWQIIGTGQTQTEPITEPDAQVLLKDDVTAYGCWVRADDRVASFTLAPARLQALAQSHPDEKIRESLSALLLTAKPFDLLQAAPPGVALLIRVAPDDDASVIGSVPPDGEPDLLQEGKDGWREINYRGVSGWVNGGVPAFASSGAVVA